MKIGVITPVHNGEKTIARAIESVLKTSKNFDSPFYFTHYIYNDASTDNTSKILTNYFKPNFKIIESLEKVGQSEARNHLLREAIKDNCKYIAFLDADDVWLEDHLEKSIDKLNYFDIVYNTPQFRNSENLPVFPNFPIPRIFIGKHLEYNNFIWISSVVAKAECFKDNKFDKELDSLEDYDMWYRLYKKNYKFTKLEKSTVIYTVNNNSEASQGNLKRELLIKKHNMNMPTLNLQLACGQDVQPGYINTDLYPEKDIEIDAIVDAREIPYDDNSLDTLRALHVIEHFDFQEGKKVLQEWYRVLKPGGKLIIETPDFFNSCKAFVEGNEEQRILLYGHFFAYPWLAGQTHKFLFTETQLKTELEWAGFKNIKRVQPISHYVLPFTVSWHLSMEAFK